MVLVSRLFVRQVARSLGLSFWSGEAGSMFVEMGRVQQDPVEVE